MLLHVELKMCIRDRLKITAFMMMDLDNLKYINDTYGHDCGDGYIRSAADVLRNNAGPHEIAARMSGDEFYVLFYGCLLYTSSSRLRLPSETAGLSAELRLR